MPRYSCQQCGDEIPSGNAVVRSVRFELMAYHEDCWALERLTRALPFVPEQRRGVQDELTELPNRL